MFVRDMDSNPRLALKILQEEMVARATLRKAPLGMGQILSCTFSDFHAAAVALLTKDPFCLLSNRDAVASHFQGKVSR
jgi:hypothetical protein